MASTLPKVFCIHNEKKKTLVLFNTVEEVVNISSALSRCEVGCYSANCGVHVKTIEPCKEKALLISLEGEVADKPQFSVWLVSWFLALMSSSAGWQAAPKIWQLHCEKPPVGSGEEDPKVESNEEMPEVWPEAHPLVPALPAWAELPAALPRPPDNYKRRSGRSSGRSRR